LTNASAHFVTRTACPACTGQHWNTWYTCRYPDAPIGDYLQTFYAQQGGRVEFDYLEGAEYAIVRCQDCGHVFQLNIPDDWLLSKLYEEWIDPTTAVHLDQKTPTAREGYAALMMMVVAYLRRPPAELKVLDFGMGWGDLCVMAMAFGVDCHGVEVSESRVRYAQSRGVQVVSGDAITNGAYDFINAAEVFEHLPRPLETARLLARALAADGLLRITVPRRRWDTKRRLRAQDWFTPSGRTALNPVSPLEHLNSFSHRDLVRMANLAGLELARLPMRLQYRYVLIGTSIPRTLKNLLIPIYQLAIPRGTVLFLRKK
jgi:SAM-dependent methyltransferase